MQRNVAHVLINTTIDLDHRQKFSAIVNKPFHLFMAIREIYEDQIEMAGPMAFERLLHINYNDYSSAQAWLSAHDNCLMELSICSYYGVPEDLRAWFLLRSLPPTDEWDVFKNMLGMMRIRGLDLVINQILEQRALLFSKTEEKALFVTKREAGKRGKDGKTIKDGKGEKSKKDRPKCTHFKRPAETCWKLHPRLKAATDATNVAQESEDEYLLLVADPAETDVALSAITSSIWVCDS